MSMPCTAASMSSVFTAYSGASSPKKVLAGAPGKGSLAATVTPDAPSMSAKLKGFSSSLGAIVAAVGCKPDASSFGASQLLARSASVIAMAALTLPEISG